MEHQQAAVKIYYSKDYNLFKWVDGNRQLNETKIKKIRRDIENGCDLLKYCPVIVYEKDGCLYILDGQHRYYVATQIKSNIWYVIADEMNLYDIARMNSNTERWTAKDFINCYSQLGNVHYAKLQAFLDSYPVPITVAIALLNTGKIKSGGGERLAFEQGKFQVKHEQQAIDLITKIQAFTFEDKYSRSFMQAVQTVIISGKMKIDDFIAKINSETEDVKRQPDYKLYLTHLETVYNKGKHGRTVIY